MPLLQGRGPWALRARGRWWRERRRAGARRDCPLQGRSVLAGRTALSNFVVGWNRGEWTDHEGVVEDEYDYAVRVIGDVCVRRAVDVGG